MSLYWRDNTDKKPWNRQLMSYLKKTKIQFILQLIFGFKAKKSLMLD